MHVLLHLHSLVCCCRYLETVNMESILSADLAMAIGEDLDNRLSAILVAFEGIIQVSEGT